MKIAFLIHDNAPFSHRNIYESFKRILPDQYFNTFEQFIKQKQFFDCVFVFDHYKIRDLYQLLRPNKIAIWILEDTYEIDQTKNVLADVVFTNDEGAISQRIKWQQNVFMLPLGFDHTIFYPQNLTKQYELVTVGNAFPNRVAVIQNLIPFLEENEMHLHIFGINWPYVKFNSHYIHISNSLITENELAVIYNSSKMTLEIHRAYHNSNVNNIKALTPGRGYSSVACGCFTIIDKREGSRQYFPYDTVAYYENMDDLKRVLLTSTYKRKEIIQNGLKIIDKHRYENRIERVFQILKEEL